ncbi:MAG: hypothetical protein J0H68_02355 [Sphingobacteriia bacterium]|nr:hypothetical protein [Sphingobacteriia bacterium]
MFDEINYSLIIDDALHYAVKKVLELTQRQGLIGNHHFFISFVTTYPGVNLSERIRSKYPDEITIVLQHQFEDLKVEDHQFSVTLSFNNVKEKVVIPFAALTAFADPSAKFGLQFRQADENFSESKQTSAPPVRENENITLLDDENIEAKANVIDLKSFMRNKKNNKKD